MTSRGKQPDLMDYHKSKPLKRRCIECGKLAKKWVALDGPNNDGFSIPFCDKHIKIGEAIVSKLMAKGMNEI